MVGSGPKPYHRATALRTNINCERGLWVAGSFPKISEFRDAARPKPSGLYPPSEGLVGRWSKPGLRPGRLGNFLARL